MAGESNFWFQLPESASIDPSLLVDQLSSREWTSYEEYGAGIEGYSGIGLTSRSASPEHINDSVAIPQSVGTFELDGKAAEQWSGVNWQELSVWNPNVTGVLESLFKSMALKPLRSRFAKLDPRTVIPPHIDDHSSTITRLHWPLVTDEKNFFCFYDSSRVVERVQMEAGKCYAVDTSVRHGFMNLSKSTKRIHLIINVGMGFSEFRHWCKSNPLFTKA